MTADDEAPCSPTSSIEILIANDLDTTLVVEAAAGTGKTTELVHRIVRVIESGRANITEIVSVTFTEKAAGELKLRLREALEQARNDRYVVPTLGGSVAPPRRRHLATRRGTNQHDSWVLRRSPPRAPCRSARRSFVQCAHRSPGAAAVRRSLQRWFQEQLNDPPEGSSVRCDVRCFPASARPRDKDEGPVDRLRNAGWELIQWRDFKADWQRPPFDRAARIDVLVERLREFAEMSSDPTRRYDNFHFDTQPARQLSGEIERDRSGDGHGLQPSRSGAHRSRPQPAVSACAQGERQTYKAGVAREDVARAREQLQADLTRFESRRECRSCGAFVSRAPECAGPV